MQFFSQQDQNYQAQKAKRKASSIKNQHEESFSETEIMSVHSGDNASENQSLNQSQIFQQNLQSFNIAQQTPKSSFHSSMPNNIHHNNRNESMNSFQSYNQSGGSFGSTYSKGGASFIRTTYQQSKQVTRQILELTVDNLKLVQIMQRVLAYLKQISSTKDLESTQQDQLSKALQVEQEL